MLLQLLQTYNPADNNVLIKATHTGDTREISLKDVRMEIAENRLVGGRPTRAYEVEECNCPQGYTGLSCQVRA